MRLPKQARAEQDLLGDPRAIPGTRSLRLLVEYLNELYQPTR